MRLAYLNSAHAQNSAPGKAPQLSSPFIGMQGTEIYTAELPASLSSPQLADLLLWFKRSCATPGLGEEFQRGDPR